jgi:hypothetical protein
MSKVVFCLTPGLSAGYRARGTATALAVVRRPVAVGVQATPRRQQRPVRVGAVDGGQANLLEVVLALQAGRGLAHLLDRRQEQRDQEGWRRLRALSDCPEKGDLHIQIAAIGVPTRNRFLSAPVPIG